jgi:Fic family protein
LGPGEIHPLLVIAIFVVAFLAIHPFQDGNGRLSRILTTLLLLRAGYAYVPYSSLESVIEQSKEAYYLALRQTQGTIRSRTPDWQPWVIYFLRALQQQKNRLADSRLATLGHLLSKSSPTTEESARNQDRTRACGPRRFAGPIGPDSRTRGRAWASDNQRGRQSNWGQPKHDQGPR